MTKLNKLISMAVQNMVKEIGHANLELGITNAPPDRFYKVKGSQ